MRPPREDTLPWYKQFWPWFLISLPLSVVIASIITINIAIRTNDGLVSDDYYKEGFGIHKDANSAARAKALGIAGALGYDADTGAIDLQLDEPLVDRVTGLTLNVTHPTRPNHDQSIQLTAMGQGRFVGRIKPLIEASWKITLHPADKPWRIGGRLTVPGSGTTRID